MADILIPADKGLPLWKPVTLRPIWRNASPDLLKVLLDPPAFFQLFALWEDEPIELDPWQVAFLRRRARFRAIEKSRQIGFSWICAMEALHRAIFYHDQTSIFVSLNEQEARNKVKYATELLYGIDEEIRRRIEFNATAEKVTIGARGRSSEILSKPATSGLRGLPGHVYIDEVDWFPKAGQDREVFTAAMGSVTRASRTLTVGSSVFGENSLLAQLVAGEDEQGRPLGKNFLKMRLPWNVTLKPTMLEGIEHARDVMLPEDFAQEYECRRGDAEGATFSQNLIRSCWHSGSSRDPSRLDPEGTFVAGFDPGGTRHPAVLTVLQQAGAGWEQVSLLSLRGESLTSQQQRLDGLLARLPDLSLALDPMGVGRQMSQALTEKWGRRVQPMNFNIKTRGSMTVDLKQSMEDGVLSLIQDREQTYQLSRTRRIPGGNVIQPGEKGRTHYDKYWALAMATSLITNRGRSIYEERGLRVLSLDDEDDDEADRSDIFRLAWRA